MGGLVVKPTNNKERKRIMSWENNCKESSTTAKTALGLSIGALGVELLGLGGGGLLGGLLHFSHIDLLLIKSR